MSITERMERDGMTFQDAAMKEAAVSGSPLKPLTLPEMLRSEAQEALWGSEHCHPDTPKEIREALANVSYMFNLAAQRIEEHEKRLKEGETRYAEHLEAWKKNSAYHAQRITDLENAIRRIQLAAKHSRDPALSLAIINLAKSVRVE